MRLLATFILLTICLTAIGQTSPTKEGGFRIDTLFAKNDSKKENLSRYSSENIDTEIKYTDSTGNVVVIVNRVPRGGWQFTDVTGTRFGYRVLWTRVINEADTPLELTITFPADSFALPEPDSYLKVFLHPDTLTQYGEASFDDARKQFEDTTFLKAFCHTPTMLQRSISPKESYLFYTVVLRHYQGSITSPRAGFGLSPGGLFFRIIPEFRSALISCGQIVFKK